LKDAAWVTYWIIIAAFWREPCLLENVMHKKFKNQVSQLFEPL